VLPGARRALEGAEHDKREKYYRWTVENPDLANLEIPKKVLNTSRSTIECNDNVAKKRKEDADKDRGSGASRRVAVLVNANEKKRSSVFPQKRG